MIDINALETRAKQIKYSIVNSSFRQRHGFAAKSPVDHTRAEARREYAMHLRAQGLTFAEIAKHFGVTAGRARDLVVQGERRRRRGIQL